MSSEADRATSSDITRPRRAPCSSRQARFSAFFAPSISASAALSASRRAPRGTRSRSSLTSASRSLRRTSSRANARRESSTVDFPFVGPSSAADGAAASFPRRARDETPETSAAKPALPDAITRPIRTPRVAAGSANSAPANAHATPPTTASGALANPRAAPPAPPPATEAEASSKAVRAPAAPPRHPPVIRSMADWNASPPGMTSETSASSPSETPARVRSNAGCITGAAVAAVRAAAPIAGTAAWNSCSTRRARMPRRIISAEAAAAAALRDMPSTGGPLSGGSGTEGSSGPSPLPADRARPSTADEKNVRRVPSDGDAFNAMRCYFFRAAKKNNRRRASAAERYEFTHHKPVSTRARGPLDGALR